MSDAEIGSWVEIVKVGNSTATISFSVGAAPGMAPGGGPAAAGTATAGGGGGTATGLFPALPAAGQASGMPAWVIPAAIAAAALLVLRK
jgi:hypothetical protein